MSADPESVIYDFALGSDHAGFERKEELKQVLQASGCTFVDLGTHTTDSVDYPDFARAVAEHVQLGKAKQGLLICGTGIGVSMTANKVPGIRAALACTPFMAEMARAHNDANVLCLGARVTDTAVSRAILAAWLGASFEGGRHARRVAKIEPEN